MNHNFGKFPSQALPPNQRVKLNDEPIEELNKDFTLLEIKNATKKLQKLISNEMLKKSNE